MFVQSTLNDLTTESLEFAHNIVDIVGQLITQLIDGIVEIQSEYHNSNNTLATDDWYTIPPVMPHELIHLRGAAFTKIVIKHLQQLNSFWDASKIDLLEFQHKELCHEYQSQPLFAQALNACDYNTTFEAGWQIVAGRFSVLRDFCGGIATAFPNTATVESDFSILEWEKDAYRMSLTDLSLEGILHCKQFNLLCHLAE